MGHKAKTVTLVSAEGFEYVVRARSPVRARPCLPLRPPRLSYSPTCPPGHREKKEVGAQRSQLLRVSLWEPHSGMDYTSPSLTPSSPGSSASV
jgi:hypothetical protein